MRLFRLGSPCLLASVLAAQQDPAPAPAASPAPLQQEPRRVVVTASGLREDELDTPYTFQRLDNRDITDRLLGMLDRDEDSVTYVEDRLGHDRRYSITSEKIRSLGWSPEVDFEDALAETVAFYRDNRDWWEPLKSRVRNR